LDLTQIIATQKDKRNCVTGQIRISLRYTSDSEAQKQGRMKVYGNTINLVNVATGSTTSSAPQHSANPSSGGINSSTAGAAGATAPNVASTKTKAKKKLKKYFGLSDEEVLHDEFSCALRGYLYPCLLPFRKTHMGSIYKRKTRKAICNFRAPLLLRKYLRCNHKSNQPVFVYGTLLNSFLAWH